MIRELSSMKPGERQYFLQHLIAPRPICFASTISAAGEVNLSPFSFFNLFSSNPPIVVFSPARRVRDNTTKHTLENVEEVPEVVINIVTFDMVQQVSLSSCEYPRGVNEFEKAGFTEEKAQMVRPPLVKESPVKLECRVNEIKKLGTDGGAGNLVICEVLVMHIDESLLDETKKPDQRKIRHVARLGGDWYCVVKEENLFQVQKPNVQLGMGFDKLPENIRKSSVLTGNELAQLANLSEIPPPDPAFSDERVQQIVQYFNVQPEEMELELHRYAQQLLSQENVMAAWQVLRYSV